MTERLENWLEDHHLGWTLYGGIWPVIGAVVGIAGWFGYPLYSALTGQPMNETAWWTSGITGIALSFYVMFTI